MKAVDTNVLVRYAVQDDPLQAARAAKFLTHDCSPEEPCFVNRVVLCEFVWVLETVYGYSRERLAAYLAQLFESYQLAIEDREEAALAVDEYRKGADFADALIAATNRKAGCEYTVTFDRKAARRSDWRLLSSGS